MESQVVFLASNSALVVVLLVALACTQPAASATLDALEARLALLEARNGQLTDTVSKLQADNGQLTDTYLYCKIGSYNYLDIYY